MSDYLCISATFLDRRFHGRGDGGEPEWPPSPLRLMQALVAANADQLVEEGGQLDAALTWLERQPPPLIIAPGYETGAAYCLSVPNNAMDLVAKAWVRGNYFGTGDASPATHRTMKNVRPIHLTNGDTVHYLWSLENGESAAIPALARAAERLVALGWGIDLVVGMADRLTPGRLRALAGQRWQPLSGTTPVTLRTPKPGTLEALRRRHDAFVHRLGADGFVPVPPLTQFDVVGYRRPTDPVNRPYAVFELRHDDGSFCAYPQRQLIHIAGMVRHLAIALMRHDPPRAIHDAASWVEQYVRGAQDTAEKQAGMPHRQFSYLPLPSIGHRQTNPSIRRVMIAAPRGDDALLEHLARRLAGQQLVPEKGDEFGDAGPPTLVRVFRDGVASYYTRPAALWASVTPVILPGHDDHRPAKRRRLIESALAQSGIEQPCDFEWSAISRWQKSLSAHKYDRFKKSTGYIRPDHLLSQTAVHLVLRFGEGLRIAGPLVIGAGRHCGLGVLAATDY